jgi:hypothetical protein
VVVWVALSLGATAGVLAQQATAPHDTTRAQIHRTLRAFYFNLARNDWEALSADILPAKVVAHRSGPEALVTGDEPGAAVPQECGSAAAPAIDRATIRIDGDWADVSVPRCAEPRGADEFRLVHFGRRWRFVGIDLLRESGSLVAER